LIPHVIPACRSAQLHARHRFQNARHNGKALLPPALGLGALQGVIRQQSEVRRRTHLARQLTGQMHILGNNIQGPTGGKFATEDRPWDVVKGAARPGADRDDLRQSGEINTRLGTDEEPFERGDEVDIAEILGDELGDAARPRFAYVEDMASHAGQ
jgi:hypothetical protein